MMSRGEVALVVASAGLQAGIVEEKLFSTAIVMTLVTTIITPVALKLLYHESAGQEEVPAIGQMAVPEAAAM